MEKIILITGSTDGIGLVTAQMLLTKGYKVLLHGRNQSKLDNVKFALVKEFGEEKLDSFRADLSILSEVKELAKDIKSKYRKLDALINNAGVFKVSKKLTSDGMDMRFTVNTVAPYLLAQELKSTIGSEGRIINLSSAAQSSVNFEAIAGEYRGKLSDSDAYAQSKLGITMWSRIMSEKQDAPIVIAVNPASFLGSKMVKEAYGMQGNDLRIGGDILTRLSTDPEFSNASGKYFDNDRGIFSSPHPDALDDDLCNTLVKTMDKLIKNA